MPHSEWTWWVQGIGLKTDGGHFASTGEARDRDIEQNERLRERRVWIGRGRERERKKSNLLLGKCQWNLPLCVLINVPSVSPSSHKRTARTTSHSQSSHIIAFLFVSIERMFSDFEQSQLLPRLLQFHCTDMPDGLKYADTPPNY